MARAAHAGGMTHASSSASATDSTRRTRIFSELRYFALLAFGVFCINSVVGKRAYIPSESMVPTLLVGDALIVNKFAYGWSFASPVFHLLPPMSGRVFGRLPERGDIVVFTPPDTSRGKDDVIKRVIGLPGDVITLRGGRLSINGRAVTVRDAGERQMPVDGNFPCSATAGPDAPGFWGYAGRRVSGADGKTYCRVHMLRETLPNGRSYDTLDFGPTRGDDFGPYRVPADHVFLLGDNRDNSADSRFTFAAGGLGGAVPVENIIGRAEVITHSWDGSARWNPLSWWPTLRSGRAGTAL